MKSMKKTFAAIALSLTLVTQANAGILILTGVIGQNLRHPVAAGVCILVFLGGTGVGIVIDEKSVDGSKSISLSEGGQALLGQFAKSQLEAAASQGKEQVEVVLTEDQAQRIIDGENLSAEQATELKVRLVTRSI